MGDNNFSVLSKNETNLLDYNFKLISKRTTLFRLDGVTQDIPQIITMDGAVGSLSDPVMIDANGLTTVNQKVKLQILAVGNSGRNTTTGQSLLLITLEENGVFTQDSSFMSSYLNENTNYRAASGDSFRSYNIGDTFQFKAWTDSVGDEDSEFIAATNNTFGSPMPSFSIRVLVKYLVDVL